MNAIEFVKKQGIKEAIKVVELHPVSTLINIDGSCVSVLDLKQIVDAFELVESKGGLRLAHIFMQSDKFKSYSWHGKIHFEKAVSLVEQCQ